MSYSHEEFTIDLTQVTQSTNAGQASSSFRLTNVLSVHRLTVSFLESNS